MENNIKNKILSDKELDDYFNQLHNVDGSAYKYILETKNKYKKKLAVVNGVPVTIGSVVYLKNPEDICGEYDNRLKDLILSSHRFAIMEKVNINDFKRFLSPSEIVKKDDTIPVCLLSTSKYLNEDKQLGMKLFDDYSKFGNGKSVYTDIMNIFIIKPSCIKEVSYHLSARDTGRLDFDRLIGMSAFKVHKGLINDYTVNINMPKYDIINKTTEKLHTVNDVVTGQRRKDIINSFLHLSDSIKLDLLEHTFGAVEIHNFLNTSRMKYNKDNVTIYNELFSKFIERLSDDEVNSMFQSSSRNYMYGRLS